MKAAIVIKSRKAPIVEITGEGSAAYVWFNRSAKWSRTITRKTWPVLNIDLDAADRVIGIEAVGYKDFSIDRILSEAGVVAPKSLLRQARYIHTHEAGSEKLSHRIAEESIELRAGRGSREKFLAALANVPDVPPAKKDVLAEG